MSSMIGYVSGVTCCECHFRQLVLLVMKARGVQLGGIDSTVRCAVA